MCLDHFGRQQSYLELCWVLFAFILKILGVQTVPEFFIQPFSTSVLFFAQPEKIK